ncbi:hypothetical protein PK35_16880 [Tamlana nanhaiensis]|uniref:Uncharacterized protein n=1 Tax=Neotamlana nanhaiensis TaxID=1382798 RepID=A0A0D7VW41_9FLAO|nr:hypothetical protein [Tamlana nanhaiensis]KJD31014.1 hypothetical protein PK35_16880 [Tamlana nanhaiensis]
MNKRKVKWGNYFASGCILILFCVVLYNTSDKQLTLERFERAFNSSFFGVVINKDYDRSNHNTPMLYFNTENSTSISSEFWVEIKIGDSISKSKGSYLIYVHRKDSIFTLDNEKIIRKIMKSKGVELDENKIPH